jgi:dynein heavy chain 2
MGFVQAVLVRCGVENEKVVFMLEDHQMVDVAFLEIINSLISAGEVPGLFSNEELDGLMAPLRDEMATSDQGYKHKSLFSYFTSRVRLNLHVVLSMDPGNTEFKMRCESNPGLFNHCSIQWMDQWSMEGLTAVPNALLKEVMDASEEDNDANLVEQMISIKSMARATPREYVSCVQTYRAIFTEKRAAQLQQKVRICVNGAWCLTHR